MTSYADAALPIHALDMDTPLPSDIMETDSGQKAYTWIMTATERGHIAQMLDTDVSAITRRRNAMAQDRGVCRGCGKHTGLDDLVHNAVYAGIHSTSFILDVLENGPKGDSPPHVVICSRCGSQYDEMFLWIPSLPW